MKINEILLEFGVGGIATVAAPMGTTQRRNSKPKKKKKSLAEEKTDLVDMFLSSTRKTYSARDLCGPACLDFINWAKKKGIELNRVRGEFIADKVVSDKKDFTPEMKKEFAQSGLDWHSAHDREAWIKQSKYAKEWHRVPHYWTIDGKGNIHDPSGYQQFIKTGLAKDLNSNRYIVDEKKKTKETLEYPLAKREDWYTNNVNEHVTRDGTVRYMSPDEFLAKARPLDVGKKSRKSIDEAKKNIKEGTPLHPLSLYSNGKEDGRHRAMAAKELGIEKVPVIMFKAH